MGKLAPGIAHELGTPLNVVQGRAKMIQTGAMRDGEAGENARLIVSELRGDFRPFIEKTIHQSEATTITEVNGQPAYWLEGAHFVEFADAAGEFGGVPVRLAKDVLLWSRGPVTFRLEGPLTKEQAVEIAESIT